MKMNHQLGTAVLLGVMAGMRSMSAPAVVSQRLADRKRFFSRDRLESELHDRRTARALLGVAGAEMVADKLPFMPARTSFPLILGRAAAGAVGGWLAAGRRHPRAQYAAAGAVAAVATAYAMVRARKWIAEHSPLPDTVVALAEDAAVAGLAQQVRL